MRQITISMVSILTALLVCAPMTSGHTLHKAALKCPPANEGVVAADAQAVVYEAGIGVAGCAYGAKRTYYFGLAPYGGPDGSGGVLPIALAGPVVAYGAGKNFAFGHSFREIWVRNLRTGKLIHRIPNGSPAESGSIGLGVTEAIMVKGDGSVAWIVRAGTALGGIQVRSADKTGSHLLAASPEIAPESLALAGSTLYWTQGGKPMSATLN
jgi:hypothetical protein